MRWLILLVLQEQYEHICQCTCMVNLVTVHYAYVHKYDFLMQMESIINFLKISLPLSLSSLFSPPPLSSIPQKFEQCTRFIDNLCSQEDLTSVFPASLSLLPPGLAKITSADFASSLAARSIRRSSDRGPVTSGALQATDKKYVHTLS